MLSMENFAKRKEIKRLEDEINRRDSEDEGAVLVVEFIDGKIIKYEGVKSFKDSGDVITLWNNSGDVLAIINQQKVLTAYSEGWVKKGDE